jgi:hypothetical protein
MPDERRQNFERQVNARLAGLRGRRAKARANPAFAGSTPAVRVFTAIRPGRTYEALRIRSFDTRRIKDSPAVIPVEDAPPPAVGYLSCAACMEEDIGLLLHRRRRRSPRIQTRA